MELNIQMSLTMNIKVYKRRLKISFSLLLILLLRPKFSMKYDNCRYENGQKRDPFKVVIAFCLE